MQTRLSQSENLISHLDRCPAVLQVKGRFLTGWPTRVTCTRVASSHAGQADHGESGVDLYCANCASTILQSKNKYNLQAVYKGAFVKTSLLVSLTSTWPTWLEFGQIVCLFRFFPEKEGRWKAWNLCPVTLYIQTSNFNVGTLPRNSAFQRCIIKFQIFTGNLIKCRHWNMPFRKKLLTIQDPTLTLPLLSKSKP